MRWGCRQLGYILLLAGTTIFLLFVLPNGAWPICLSFFLIMAGLCLIRH